jgi:predicted RNA-binding Zn ribbon-like protein
MEHKDWDFDSGNLVLDFANTAEFHASDDPDEKLETFPDLVSWSQAANLLSKTEARDLLLIAERDPKKARKSLSRALTLREIVYRIISAAAEGESPKKSDLSRFNQYLSEAIRNSQISPSDGGFSWSWQEEEDPSDRILWMLVRETANLITSEEIERVGECADDRGCGYLFIDTSRNHSRRWCSMEDCGNRAKAQRHYQKISKNRPNS